MKAYVRLLEEGTDVWRPVEVEPAGDGRYRILGDEGDDEIWECKPGAIVRLVEAELSDGPARIVAPA